MDIRYPRRAPIGPWLSDLSASHQVPITSCVTFDDCPSISGRFNQLAGAGKNTQFPVVAKDIYQECVGDFIAVNRFSTAFHLNMDGGVTSDNVKVTAAAAGKECRVRCDV